MFGRPLRLCYTSFVGWKGKVNILYTFPLSLFKVAMNF